MTNMHFDTYITKAAHNRPFLNVRSRYLVAKLRQYFSNTAHAGTANTQHKDMLGTAHLLAHDFGGFNGQERPPL